MQTNIEYVETSVSFSAFRLDECGGHTYVFDLSVLLKAVLSTENHT